MKSRFLFVMGFLAWVINAQAQLSREELSKRFNSYQSVWIKNRLHLVLNQTKFSPGDTVWFKAYLLADDNKIVPGRQLVNVNLIDSKGESKIHILFTIKDGIGNNQIIIPDTLSAGIYLLTAYTNWIRNFGDELIFKKKISIVTSNTILEQREPIYDMHVEGGHLIAGIFNRIVFRTSKAGSSVRIENHLNQQVGTVHSNKYGIAVFEFTPEKGSSYFAHAIDDDFKSPLPAVEDDGCSIHLNFATGSINPNLKIEIPTSSKYRGDLFAFIVSQNKIYSSSVVTMDGKDSIVLPIPIDKLPVGVAQISILTSSGKLLASRDFYCSSNTQVQRMIELDKEVYHTREKITARISLKDPDGKPLSGEFSVSVLNKELFDSTEDFLLNEPTVHDLENSLINQPDSSWKIAINNWSVTAPRPVPWQEIISDKNVLPKYPKTDMIEKTGLAYIGNTDEAVPDETQVMFYLQKNSIPHQTFIMQGRAGLVIPEIYGDDEFFYMARTPRGKEIQNLRMNWEDDQIQLPHAPVWKESKEIDSYAEFSSKRKIINQSFNVYTPELTNSVKEASSFEGELASADVVVMVQDFLIFPTMAELIREVIPSLYHRKTRKGEIVRVGLLPPMIETHDPLYIIDGVATKNTNFFLSLKPADIISVKIINDPKKLMPLGLFGRNGIVLVQTKTGEAREPLDDPKKKITGLNKTLSFATPWEKSEITYTPFFRSTIYWNPTISTDTNGQAEFKFTCTDDMGRMNIRIEGMANGKPFSILKGFEVVK
ncbi:MAG: hypothetical protein JNL53_19720 [Cyclobacteriaceae bacterium]|nr:hypothetical protein [Cyclobacteriaceae bacterium]